MALADDCWRRSVSRALREDAIRLERETQRQVVPVMGKLARSETCCGAVKE